MPVNIKAMRYEIICPVDCTWDKLGKTLRDVQYAVWRIYNRTIQMTWDFQQITFGYRARFGESLKFESLGTGRKTQHSDIYELVTGELPHIPTGTVDCAIRDAQQRFKALSKDVLSGKASIPSYKRDVPIPVRAQGIKLAKDARDYTVRLPLLSQKGAKEYDSPTSFTVKVRAKGSAKSIFDRLLTGEYTLCDSEVLQVKRKWYVNLTYKHETKPKELSQDNVMGIDLGVVNAAVLAYNNSQDRYFFEGDEIRAFRARVEARRNAMLRQGKHCGDGRIGHGRATRIQPIEKLRGRVEDFKANVNHRYSRKIVDEAIRQGCGVIQMEDLTGIGADSMFLKSWTYYDLQQKITYKAKEVGIVVRKINPKYTSQRCSNCGHIAQANRDITQSQSKFECVACGYKTNADYNAARNIATPGIESIIESELERVKHAIKFAE